METIINYKIKEFFLIEDFNLISEFINILEHLKPLKSIENPNYNKYKFWDKKQLKTIVLKDRNTLTFGDVTMLRNLLNDGKIDSIIESIKIVTGLDEKQILDFTITQFYGIINYITAELIDLSNMESNELTDDSFDFNLEAVSANKRMAKFGVLNTIDALAKEDVLRWQEIEKLPYMLVFTKLLMDKEKNDIQREINEIQKKKMKQQ